MQRAGWLFVVGLASEARLLRPRWRAVISGADCAQLVARLAAATADRPAGIVSFGLGGGLAPGLEAGRLVIGEAVITQADRVPCEAALSNRLAERLPDAVRGDVAGASDLVATPAAKAQLHTATGALAADMESGAAAACAAQHGIPLLVVRAVSDDWRHGLPAFAAGAIGQDGAVRPLRLLAALAAQPSGLASLPRLARDSARAHRALARAVAGLTELLPA